MTIGMNLSQVANNSMEFPFIDRFKSFGDWFISGGGFGGYDPAPANLFNANGWPIAQPPGAEFRASIVLDPVGEAPTTRYVLTYSGTANFGFTGATVVSREAGRIVIDAPYGGVALGITTNASDPVHDIHLVRQDEVAAFNAGEIFDPAFLARTQNWSVLRFMDWNNTNGSDITSWSQRSTLASASWGNVPIEVEVRLANQAHSDMWVNIPAKADDDYVRQLATYVHNNLDPGLKLHVEYSNEVWNQSFSQSAYAQQQADALWGHGSSVSWGNEVYYGYRSAQIAAIVKSVYGADAATRYDGILSTFSGWTGPQIDDAIADGVARANVGSISSLFKEYGVTTYFGDALGVYPGNEADRSIVLGWAASGAAGLNAAFQQLEHGGLLSADFSLDSMISIYAIREARAQSWGLNMVAYEGGLSAYWFMSDHQADLTDFFQRLVADPRMGALYARMVADFTAAGGTELNAFTDVGGVGIFGPWGATSTVYETSPRYEALIAASGRSGASVTPLVVSNTTAAATYTMADGATQITYTGSGSFTGTGNSGSNTITGGDGGNHLYGMDGNDTLIGGAGADYLDGGSGADRMTGGAGDDIYIVDYSGDVVIELPGGGTDEVRTTLARYTTPDNVENLTFIGTGDFTGIGNALDNVITGGAGNDTLDGGTGADRLIGGAGNDTYIVDNAGDVVVELAGGGIDEVRTALAAYTLTDNVENLTYTGTGNFAGTGNALANVITGGAGNDTLDGGAGADRLIGGAGDDTYIVDDAGDIVVELAGGGTDEVRTALLAYTLTDNVENLTYTGTGNFTGTGNALANVLKATNGGSHLYGLDGNDTLIGGTGADYLDGGAGADRMAGGTGDDIYIVDNAGDVVVELAGEGNDEVRTTLASYTLAANVEALTFVGTGNFTGTGNALANTITGGVGNDWLDGGAGDDLMIGGMGDDTYVVDSLGDVARELPNGGTDTVRTALTSYTLGSNLENLTYTGTGTRAFTGTGNELDNVITGSTTATNILFGGAGHDTLIGGAGADYLNGGTGADIMTGGAGNDVYIVDTAQDVIVEQQNGGVDTVLSSALSYVLSANVENLTFTGSGNFTGTGNAGNNLITGGSGNDTLYGGDGNDTLSGGWGNDYLDGGPGADKMIGGMGDDTYIVDDGSDKVMESPGEGYDTVITSATFTLPSNVEKLILAEGFTIDGKGNSLANVILGNAQNNQIWGYGGNDYIDAGAGNDAIDAGDGNDTIIGGAGKDVMTGGAGADTFVFRPGDMGATLTNADRITDFSHSEGDHIDFSALRLSPGTALSFIGNGAFGHHAGEVRSVVSGYDFDVSIDLDGDGVADLHLLVGSRTGALVSSDFIL